jgi:hypothetical protein
MSTLRIVTCKFTASHAITGARRLAFSDKRLPLYRNEVRVAWQAPARGFSRIKWQSFARLERRDLAPKSLSGSAADLGLQIDEVDENVGLTPQLGCDHRRAAGNRHADIA